MREFYRRFDGQGTPAPLGDVCPAEDLLTQQLIDQNMVLRQRCGSVPLEAVKEALQAARQYVDILMQIIFDIINIVTDMMQLAGPLGNEARQRIYTSLLYWFQELVRDMGQALKAWGDMIFKMIFENSPLGDALKVVVQAICAMVSWIVNDVWKGFFCPIAEKILPPLLNFVMGVLDTVKKALEGINSVTCALGFCIEAGESITGAITSIDDFKRHIENGGLECNKRFNDICFSRTNATAEDAALPVATRCWSGYQPSVGDASALSCTRADTCFNPVTGAQTLCDACPLQQGEDFLSFACSSLTKRCTCGVQRFERTR